MAKNSKGSVARRPRILWANRYCLLDTSSGGSMSIYQILKQLKAQGWDVEVFGATIFDSESGTLRLAEHWEAIQSNPDKIINIQDEGIVHHLVVTESIRSSEMTLEESSRWYHAYCAILDQFKPDLVFLYGGTPVDLLISSEARTRGIPSAAYLVNENYSGARWCQDVDIIITDTQATSDFYYEKDGIRPVPVGKFIVPEKVVAQRNQRNRVVFINPSLQKGAGIVAQLALLLEKRRPDIQFEVVESRGNWHDVVIEVTASLGEKRESLSNVIVTPNTDDIRTVYSNARILLLPSLWWESGARVLAESMLNGIPAIVTAYGGNQEMIQNGGVYFTVPPECHEKPYTKLPNIELMKPLADKIVQFFDDEQYYQMYVERAYAVGKRLHDINVSTQRLIEAFRPLIEKRAGDLDHQALLKQVHKHGIVGRQVSPLSVPLQTGERGLFIDCGGYDGCSAVKFMLQNPQFDSITFEPNPALWPHYADVPTTLIKKAAYTHGGMVTFTIDETDADGSSLVDSKKIDWHGKIANEECPKIEVSCVDIAELVRKAATQYQKIVLKLDIEGAEYDVLEKLLQEDLIKHLTIIYAEFHWHKCGFPESRHNQLVAALKQQTQVAEWDALDFAIYRGSDERTQQRAATVRAKLGDLSRYQNLSLLPKE